MKATITYKHDGIFDDIRTTTVQDDRNDLFYAKVAGAIAGLVPATILEMNFEQD